MSPMPPGPAEMRRDLLWLLLGAVILYGAFLGSRDLWNPNEPIYGQAVVEMSERGDWVRPTVNGELFDEKPILYYWLALGASLVAGGVSEASLRLPLAASGVIGVALVYLLVCPYAGRGRARLAAVLFATTFVVWWTARAVQMDLLVAVTTLGCLLAVTRILDHRANPALGWTLAGFAAGLGFLAKGPVGLILPALVVLVVVVTRRRWDLLRPLPLAIGALAFLAVAAPWYVTLWARGETGFLLEVLVRQNLTRFVTPWDHQAGWWYYLLYFWIDMAPWALFVPLALRLPDREPSERKLDRLAWIWILAVVIFFSLSGSKRSPYILPVAPAVAVLVSGVARSYLEGRLERWRVRAALCVLACWGVVLAAAGMALRLHYLSEFPLVFTPGRAVALLLVGGGAAIFSGLLLVRRTPAAAPAALLACILCAYLLVGAWLLPEIDVYKSARPFCREVVARVAPEEPLATYRPWKWRAGYVYYTGRRIERLETAAELRDYWGRAEPVWLLVEGSRLEQAREVIGNRKPLLRRQVGSKQAYLFSNQNGRSE